MENKYIVTKDIEEGWESSAVMGDVLTVNPNWEGLKVLMKDGNAVCDIASEYAREHCQLIK